VTFVDEPRQAVEEVDRLIAATMKRLAEIFAEERQKLEHQWDQGDNVSTEDLRIALRRYRSFFFEIVEGLKKLSLDLKSVGSEFRQERRQSNRGHDDLGPQDRQRLRALPHRARERYPRSPAKSRAGHQAAKEKPARHYHDQKRHKMNQVTGPAQIPHKLHHLSANQFPHSAQSEMQLLDFSRDS
jgi:hypothetical protein